MVAAKVACTNCWSFLRASRMVVGRRVRCPKCKKAFQVRPIGDDDLNHRERSVDLAESPNADASRFSFNQESSRTADSGIWSSTNETGVTCFGRRFLPAALDLG